MKTKTTLDRTDPDEAARVLDYLFPLTIADFREACVNALAGSVAVLQEKYFGISWVPIHFRKRMGGTASVKTYSFAKHGVKLI